MGMLCIHKEKSALDNVGELKDRARGAIVDQIDRRSTDLGNTVNEHVTNLRSMGGTLRDQGQNSTANLIDAAADRLGSISTYLQQTDGDRIVHDVESFARKQAVLTGAIGLIGGFIAARVLKASASERYRTYGYDSAFDESASGYGSSTYSTGTTANSTYGAGYSDSGTSGRYGRDRTEAYDDVSTQ